MATKPSPSDLVKARVLGNRPAKEATPESRPLSPKDSSFHSTVHREDSPYVSREGSHTNLAAMHQRRLARARTPSWSGAGGVSSPVSPIKRLSSQFTVTGTGPQSPDTRAPLTSPKSNPKINTLSDLGKKQLVDQFYDTSMNNSNETFNTSGENKIHSGLPSPGTHKLLDGFDYDVSGPGSSTNGTNGKYIPSGLGDDRKMTDSDFAKLVQNGGLQFSSTSNRLENNDDHLTGYLLNIDNFIKVWSREQHLETLEPLQEFVDSITTAYSSNAAAQLTAENVDPAMADLDAVSAYLDDLTKQTNQLLVTLTQEKDQVKLKYQSALRDSVNKLQQLSKHLSVSEVHLNDLRRRVNVQKTRINHDLRDRIKLLDEINFKVRGHYKAVRRKRFRHFNVVAAVVLVMSAIYYGYRMWG
ncbi:hypothetical protein DICA4_D07822 [Diutina catenulata]